MMLLIFINFVLDYVWKWHALLMYYIYVIEETTSIKKTSIILGGIKEKQLCFENLSYRVFIVVMGTTTS